MKHPLKSRTVLSALTVIGSVIAMLLGDIGVIGPLSAGLVNILQGLAGAGGAMSIYGRWKANGPLKI